MTEQEKRSLIDSKKFIDAWFKLLPSHTTYEAAYEALEDIYVDYFKRRRYSDYSSFKTVKIRLYKSNKR